MEKQDIVMEILNYMWDNNIIIASEYEFWETLDLEHRNILINDALKFAKNNTDFDMIKKIQKNLEKLLTK